MRRRRLPGLGLRLVLGVLGVLGAGTLAWAATSCAPGEHLVGGACEECGVGYFSDAHDAHPCFECPGGYYTPYTGSNVCTPCEAGKASGPAWNQTACAACEPGTFNPFRIVLARGSTLPTSTECHGCLKGKYSDAAGSTTCTECALGKYQFYTGKTECEQCPAGTYGTTLAQVSRDECALCGAGRYATLDNTDCEDCPAGTFAPFMPGGGVNQCVACEAPFVAEGTRNYKCELCGVGMYFFNATECRECAAGTYGPVEHQTACVECEAGKYQTGVRGSACEKVFDPDVQGADTTTLQYESTADEVTGVPGWRLVRFIPTDEEFTTGDSFAGTLELNTPFSYENAWSVSFGEFSEILAGKCSLDTGEYIWIDGTSTFHTYNQWANPTLSNCNADISNFDECPSTILVQHASYYYHLSIGSTDNKVTIFKRSLFYSTAAGYSGISNAIYGENFAGEHPAMCVFVRDSTGTSRTPRAVEARTPGASQPTSCRPGTFEDRATGICATCAKGKYQTDSGRTVCNECASGKTTARRGAPSAVHCWLPQKACEVRQSLTGHDFSSNESICTTCPAKTYLNAGMCELCPPGYTTTGGGQTAISILCCVHKKDLHEKGYCLSTKDSRR